MSKFRIGIGNDLHRLEENRKLIIGGVEIPHSKGLFGHSDADVLVHAIIDSLFGALALGDIGSHFPDNDDAYKDFNSMVLLKKAYEIIKEEGYRINNIDSIINAQRPKLREYIDDMRSNIANVLGIDISQVSVKAKTGEKIGVIGEEQGMSAQSVVMLESFS